MSTNQENVNSHALLADLVAQTDWLHYTFLFEQNSSKRLQNSIVQVYWCFQLISALFFLHCRENVCAWFPGKIKQNTEQKYISLKEKL